MVRRSTRILLEIFLGCLAGMILLIVVTVWRLSQAPVHLYFLSPFLEQAFSDPDAGVSAEIEDTVLVLGEKSRTLDLKALGIRLLDSEGFTIASLPEVSINLSLRALVQGVVAPTKIEVIGARVTLIRTREGDFNFGQNIAEQQRKDPQAEGLADLSVIIPELVEEMLSDSDPARPLSFLRTVRIRGGSLTIYDRKLKTFWHAPEANMTLRREREGLSGDMDLKLAVGQIEMDLALTLLYRERDAQTILAANFVDLQLGAFAGLDERLAPMAGFHVPLRGAVSGVLEKDGSLRSIMFDLTGGAGVLSLPEYLPETLTVEQMDLKGSLDGAAEQLQLDQVSIAFGGKRDGGGQDGPVVSVNGLARVLEGDFHFDVEGRVSRVAADELGLYWPVGLGEGARDWVTTNIRRGTAEEAAITVALRVPSGDFDTVEVESMTGRYGYRDLDVHYLRPMPPVNGVSGTATFDLSRMTFDIAGGVLGDLTVGQSFVEIDFRDNPEQIFIDLPVSGSLRSSLELLDHERLNLVSGLGIQPADSSGTGQVRAQFGFPLINDLTFDNIEVGVTAELQEVGVKQVLFGRDATNGALDLKLDNAGMTITGPVELDGLPADLKWRENFGNEDDDGPVSVFEVEAPGLDETDLANFGLDLRPYLKGTVAASVIYARQADRTSDLDLVLDLDRALFAFPVLYWSKAPGSGGRMRLGARLAEDKVVAIERIEVRAGTLTAIGRGMMDETGSRLARLDLDELQFGRSRLSDVIVSLNDETIAVDAGNGVLDAVPFMESRGGGEEDEQPGEEVRDAFTIRATRLDAVLFGPDRRLENVTLKLERRSEGWENIAITADIPEAYWTRIVEEAAPKDRLNSGPVSRSETGTHDEVEIAAEPEPDPEVEPPPPEDRFFRLRYRPAATGGYFLKAVSNDVGALLRAMDLRDTMRGGHLELVGQSDGPIPYHSLTAHLEVTDYALVGAPTLAKVLTVASMTGLRDTLSGKGIWFDRLSGDVTLTDGVVETQLLHAYGSALGVTAKGRMDFDRAELDLEGTVVPAYTINRFLGKIPGLGFLLTGGEHGGFLAFTYDVEGAFDDPNVEVDALSGLAPGFLRGLFGGIDGEAPTVFPPGPDR